MNLLAWLRGAARHRLRLRLAAATVAALAFTTFAFAAHLHALDEKKGDARDAICAFCLHAERLGAAPEPPAFALATLPAEAATPPTRRRPLRPAPAHRYRSRAPPA